MTKTINHPTQYNHESVNYLYNRHHWEWTILGGVVYYSNGM